MVQLTNLSCWEAAHWGLTYSIPKIIESLFCVCSEKEIAVKLDKKKHVSILCRFLVLSAYATCNVYLIMYGLTFGLIKCYLWMTAVIFSIMVGLAIVQPSKILVMSFLISQITRVRRKLFGTCIFSIYI